MVSFYVPLLKIAFVFLILFRKGLNESNTISGLSSKAAFLSMFGSMANLYREDQAATDFGATPFPIKLNTNSQTGQPMTVADPCGT